MEKNKNQEYIDILAEESSRGKLVIFVGAGVSINSKLPSWNSLVERYSKRMKLEKRTYNSEETLIIPQIYYDKFGKIKYYEVLNKTFQGNFKPHKIHDFIEQLDPNYIITTNYDNLLEDKLNKTQKYDIVVKEEDLAYSQSDKMIIKMHGDLKNKNVVLKKSDYDNYEKNRPLITTFIKSLFTTNTVLFIGYSLNDINIKNILHWINEILKEDFRRVYLADLSSSNLLKKYENENNKIINRIFLVDTHLEEKNIDLGNILADFLENIIKTKKRIKENLNNKLYKELNYLMDTQLNKVLKKPVTLGYEWFSDNIILNKEISKKEFENIINNFNYLLKSNVIEIQDSSSENKHPKKEFDSKVEENHIKNITKKQIMNYIICFDYENAEKFFSEKKINNPQLLAYIYFQKKEYSKAKELLKNSSENQKSNEMKIWNYSIIKSIEQREKYNFLKENRKYYEFNLKKEYAILFGDVLTDLYKEIFDDLSLNYVKNKMNEIYDKIRTSKKNMTLGAPTPLKNAEILIRDFLSYCFFNGIIIENKNKVKSIFKNFIEILFISYTNNIQIQHDIQMKNINKIIQFDYLSLYIMLYIDVKDLKILLKEYNIDILKVQNNEINFFINAFKNFLNCEDVKNTNPSCRKKLNNFFIILNHLKLNSNDLFDIVDFLFCKEYLSKLSSDEIILLIDFSKKNIENIPEKVLGNMLTALIKSKNKFFKPLVNIFTYYLKEKNIKEFFKKDEIEAFCENNFENKIEIKLYFTRVVSEEYKKEIINEALEKLKFKFDIPLFSLMVELKLVNINEEYEDLIISYLENQSLSNIENYYEITPHIISLNLNFKTSDTFKKNLKNLKNKDLNKILKAKKFYNIWNYSIDKENIDISSFSIEDLKLLTEKGLEDFFMNNKEKELENLIENYLKDKYNDKILNAFLKLEKTNN